MCWCRDSSENSAARVSWTCVIDHSALPPGAQTLAEEVRPSLGRIAGSVRSTRAGDAHFRGRARRASFDGFEPSAARAALISSSTSGATARKFFTSMETAHGRFVWTLRAVRFKRVPLASIRCSRWRAVAGSMASRSSPCHAAARGFFISSRSSSPIPDAIHLRVDWDAAARRQGAWR